MAAGIPAKYLGFLFALATGPAFANDAPLVELAFDENLLQSGPDTYQVFKDNGRKAAISSRIAYEGSASLHLTDTAYDGDFVELQGYFEPHNNGVLSIEFSFLIAEPEGAFNVALTGPKKYRLHKHGINFWLNYDGQWLRNYSNSIPKKIFEPSPFHWYTVRADLNLDKSEMDLRIADEYGQVNYQGKSLYLAPGKHPEHSVQEYSFVGDIRDLQPADFFIDSLRIWSSTGSKPAELIAPGRKKLFVERWSEYQSHVAGKLRCLPAINFDDIAIDDNELGELFTSNEMASLIAITEEQYKTPANMSSLHPKLQALAHWREACSSLEQREGPGTAQKSIDQALVIAPDAYIYRLSDIIIQSEELTPQEILYRMSDLRTGDIRSEIALAMLAARHQPDGESTQFFAPDLSIGFNERLTQLDSATKANLVSDPSAMAVEQLKAFMPEDWENYLAWAVAMEFSYLALLGNGEYEQARQLAGEMSATLETLQLPTSLWLERGGDTSLLLGQPQLAIEKYRAARASSGNNRIDLRLSDAYFMLGDHTRERALRESIYRNFDRE